eukprot:COSAG02_NODE_7_length_64539_cov_120.393482_31_plen_186_part_00
MRLHLDAEMSRLVREERERERESCSHSAVVVCAYFSTRAHSILVQRPVGFLNDGRDLTGAIDGTKNPDATLRTVVEQASIGPRDYPDGAHLGGSFVFCSKFAHRLADFRAMDAYHQAGVSRSVIGVGFFFDWMREAILPQWYSLHPTIRIVLDLVHAAVLIAQVALFFAPSRRSLVATSAKKLLR